MSYCSPRYSGENGGLYAFKAGPAGAYRQHFIHAQPSCTIHSRLLRMIMADEQKLWIG